MTSSELRKVFLDFFEKNGHKIVASSSLIPVDPTSLFTSAGMQQFVPYLSGEVEPPYRRACSVQKCLRVNDVDEVGNATHHTFFEMLGNWSFGDYFKGGAIDLALEFLVDILGFNKDRIWVSVFSGEKGIPRDEEAIKIWQSRGVPKERIREFGMKDNFWGPVISTGPCGPCSEVLYDFTQVPCHKGENCVPDCECGRFVELWNLVFMEYNKDAEGNYVKLPKQNVDTGIGFERLLSVLENTPSNYETDLFWPIIQEIEKVSGKSYVNRKKAYRIIADHLRGASFVIAAGVLPSNIERGYVLRMLLRRIIRHAKVLDLPKNWYVGAVKKISEIYGGKYPEVMTKQTDILTVIQKEEEKFGQTLKKGLKQFQKLIEAKTENLIAGKEAFDLYQSYGFPLELTREMAKEAGFRVDGQGFQEEVEAHKKISRAGADKKFGGVGIEQLETEEQREKATRLHTATHLLHAALREILGRHIKQMGSDIVPERLRFDFSHTQALTQDEIKNVEKWVNQKISQDLEVKKEEMPYKKALDSGALAFFGQKYPRVVNVYTIQDRDGNVVSKEVCAGPHTKSTTELGTFKIIKEESVGAGLRRIKAILE